MWERALSFARLILFWELGAWLSCPVAFRWPVLRRHPCGRRNCSAGKYWFTPPFNPIHMPTKRRCRLPPCAYSLHTFPLECVARSLSLTSCAVRGRRRRLLSENCLGYWVFFGARLRLISQRWELRGLEALCRGTLGPGWALTHHRSRGLTVASCALVTGDHRTTAL